MSLAVLGISSGLLTSGGVTGATPLAVQAAVGGAQFAAVGLAWLLPLGVALIGLAALQPDRALDTARRLVVMTGLAIGTYWAVGFGLQFGGVGLALPAAGLGSLAREWSLLDVSLGPGWGMLGLAGFLPGWTVAHAPELALLSSHLPWVATTAVVLALAWSHGVSRWVRPVGAVALGSALYPLFGNWLLGGGWLANLGENLGLGHGLVDSGASVLFLVPGLLGFAGVLLARRRERGVVQDPDGFPPVHLPLLALTGLALAGVGLWAAVFTGPLAAARSLSLERAALNLTVGSLSAMLAASLYSWVATSRGDLLVAARAGMAGLAAMVAPAPFVPGWSALAIGLLIGLLLPPLMYAVDRVARLDEPAGVTVTFVMSTILGLLSLGVFADGGSAIGWNGVGIDRFLGFQGLGVTGFFARDGFTPGWQGQLYAQLVGIGAALVWALLIPWAIGGIAQLIGRAIRR